MLPNQLKETYRAVTLAITLVLLVTGAALVTRAYPLAIVITATWWACAAYLDFSTTREAYRSDPAGFTGREKNPVLSNLVDRFGFNRGIIAHLLLVILPTLLFFGLFSIPAAMALYTHEIVYLPGISAVMGGLAFFHTTAWVESRAFVQREGRTRRYHDKGEENG